MAGEGRVLTIGRRAWAVLGILGVVVLLGFAAQQVSVVVTAFALALFPAALLSPIAERLRDTAVPNALTAALLVLGLILVFVLPAWLIVPRFVEQAPELGQAVVDGIGRIEDAIDWDLVPGNAQGLTELVQSFLSGGGDAFDQGVAALGFVLHTATGIVLLLVIAFFCLKDGRRLWRGVLDLLPESRQEEIDLLAGRAWWNLGAYLRGQLLIALFDAVFIGLGLWLLGIPLALPLTVLVFFGGLFPIVGAFVSGAVAVLVALADQGLVTSFLVFALVLAVQQVETNILEPLIMSNIVALHPLVVILSVTTGGLLLGVLGAFLAVPVAAIIARIVEHLRGRPPAAGPSEA